MISEVQNTSLDKLVAYLKKTLSPSMFSDDLKNLVRTTIKLLSNGDPVSIKEISLETSLRDGKVRDYVAQLEGMGMAELNDEGEIVGMILSLLPTRHSFLVNGKSLYAWCAADALFLPSIIGKSASVRSKDPLTGDEISIEVTQNSIELLSPEGGYLSLVAPGMTPDVGSSCKTGQDNAKLVGRGGALCDNIYFFASEDSARKWQNGREGYEIMSIREGSEIARDIWAKSLIDKVEVDS